MPTTAELCERLSAFMAQPLQFHGRAKQDLFTESCTDRTNINKQAPQRLTGALVNYSDISLKWIPIVLSLWGAGLTFYVFVLERGKQVGELRAWTNRCVEHLQTLAVLASFDSEPRNSGIVPRERFVDLAADLSVLAEQGRFLFWNNPRSRGGSGAVFVGWRPAALDPLVEASRIALVWSGEDAADKPRLQSTARDLAKEFVSLMQPHAARGRIFGGRAGRSGRATRTIEELRNASVNVRPPRP